MGGGKGRGRKERGWTMADKTRMQQIQGMLADDPTDATLRYMLAMEHASQGDDASAARCFRELMDNTPDYVPAYMQAGRALVRLGKDDEAKTVFQRGIEIAGQ